MDSNLIYSIGIGLAIGGLIYVPLSRSAKSAGQNRSIGIVSFGIGCVISIWLSDNSSQLNQIMSELVSSGIKILFAGIAVALGYWQLKKYLP